MSEILISFIMPVYNGEKTIEAAMESVFSLPVESQRVEIIVIDDCSQDGTAGVVEKYALSHPSVRLLRQKENRRQGAARNRGLEEAVGEYIAYLDADDIILPGICKAIEKSAENHLDMCGYVMEIPNGDGAMELLRMPEFETSFISGIELIAAGQSGYRFLMPTCFVFSHKFLEQCRHPFVEGHRVEDSDFALYHLVKARRVGTVQEHGYHYCFNSSSTIHTFTVEMLSDYILHAERVKSIMEEFRSQYPLLPEIYRNYMGEIVFLRFGVWYLSHLTMKEILAFYSMYDKERRYGLCNLDFVRYKRIQKMALAHRYITIAVFSVLGPYKKLRRRILG